MTTIFEEEVTCAVCEYVTLRCRPTTITTLAENVEGALCDRRSLVPRTRCEPVRGRSHSAPAS